MSAWIVLFLAIVLEVIATVQLKLSAGFSKTEHSITTVVLFALSFVLAAYAFQKIDLGLAYAIWTGIGTVGIFTVGILYFNEPSNLLKLFFVALIVIGVVGLHYSSS